MIVGHTASAYWWMNGTSMHISPTWSNVVEHSKQRSGFGTAGVFSGDFLSSLGGHIELKNVTHDLK